jgi:hypothetical protein
LTAASIPARRSYASTPAGVASIALLADGRGATVALNRRRREDARRFGRKLADDDRSARSKEPEIAALVRFEDLLLAQS